MADKIKKAATWSNVSCQPKTVIDTVNVTAAPQPERSGAMAGLMDLKAVGETMREAIQEG